MRYVYVLIYLALVSAAAADESFVLTIPGQDTFRSTAEFREGSLIIRDDTGQVFRYERRRELDTRSGDYLAFYSRDARRYLRWPARGEGRMLLGEARGATIDWKESLMQIQPRTPTGTPTTPPGQWTDARLGPMNLAFLPLGDGRDTAAYIDTDGRLQMYADREDRWERMDVALEEKLIAGAPLALVPGAGPQLPDIYTVNPAGRLVQIMGGGTIREVPIADLPSLTASTHLARPLDAVSDSLYLSDPRGRLARVDLSRRRVDWVERREGYFPPGCPLAVSSESFPRLAAVSDGGQLVTYRRLSSAAWSKPQVVATGFVPGTAVAITVDAEALSPSDTVAYLAAVDAGGLVRVLRGSGEDWSPIAIDDVRLSPGAPLGLYSAHDGLSLTGIDAAGVLRQWQRGRGGWTDRTISEGFIPGYPVAIYGERMRVFAVDRRGRLIAARHTAAGWGCAVCDPRYALAPTLASRNIIPNPPLPPVEIELLNRHQDELSVRINDHRTPSRPTEVRIPAGTSKTVRIERDGGATFEEVYLVPGPFGSLVEQVNRYPLPPQSLYDVVVYADRVTSMYFDRTQNRSNTPDSIQRSLVSIGVFPIPAGDLVKQGDRIDVYSEAKYQRNPGAAAIFGRP